jgi:hypothetical protein
MKRALLLCCAIAILVAAAQPILAASPQFFGIQVYEASDADEAFSVQEGVDTDVEYSYTPRMVNTSIHIWGTLEAESLVLNIVNQSDESLHMSFYTDEYGYYTFDDDIFMLEVMMSESAYPASIDAGTSEEVALELPSPEHIGQVKFVAALIDYGQTALIAKPIESR